MKITDVEAIVLESPWENTAPEGSEEASGVKHCLLLKVSTDEGIPGWADIETAPHIGRAAVMAPASGIEAFDGLRTLVLGEDPFDVERLWDKVYRGSIYYGRRGVAIQVLSGFDIACHDIIGKAIGRPVYKILGGAYRDRVRAYASTLFRPTPDDIKRACAFYLERGFTAIKFGWGVFGQDRARDVALVRAAREAIGPVACGALQDGRIERARPRIGDLLVGEPVDGVARRVCAGRHHLARIRRARARDLQAEAGDAGDPDTRRLLASVSLRYPRPVPREEHRSLCPRV